MRTWQPADVAESADGLVVLVLGHASGWRELASGESAESSLWQCLVLGDFYELYDAVPHDTGVLIELALPPDSDVPVDDGRHGSWKRVL